MSIHAPLQYHPDAFRPHIHKAWVVLPNNLRYPAYALCKRMPHTYSGELVFNTSFAGYTEIITDPSYADQLVLFTHPHVGSYGIDPAHFQSGGPQCTAVLLNRLDYASDGAFAKWLLEADIPILFGLPTRELTQHIRHHGAMRCQIIIDAAATESQIQKIEVSNTPATFSNKLLDRVSCSEPRRFGNKGHTKLAVYDFGIKKNILHLLERRGCYGTCYPWHTSFETVMSDNPDGLVLSNGPGDPREYTQAVLEVAKAIGNIPILAICLGHQLLCLALGGQVTKLKFGHRGGNHPVQDLRLRRTYIAAHNHGYAVLEPSINGLNGVQTWFKNLTDQSLAGVISESRHFLSVQFHPEGAPGPHDTHYVFDEYLKHLATFKHLNLSRAFQEVTP